jgi:type II secretory pathway predicted ATPase ExeA
MNQFAVAKELFMDNFDLRGYLDSFTFEMAKKELLKTLNAHEVPMTFILGNPGSGKSFLLNFIQERADSIKLAKFFPNPHFDEKELLEVLLESAGVYIEHNSQSVDTMIKTLKQHYKNLEQTVFIDEAQLLTEKQLEFLRVLSDMKMFQLVLAMHKKEGEYVLSKPHFKSRTTKTIVLEHLKKEEVNRYIQNRLLSKNLSEVASAFGKKEVNLIYKHSQANFRTMKKLLKTVCEIVEIAQRGGLKKYHKVDTTTLTMAAIDIGLIDVK